MEIIQTLLVLLLMFFGIGTDSPAPVVTPEDSAIEVHFIDVGQADAALILCDGEAMLIDGGNVDDSDVLYTYLSDRNIDYLKYAVVTHAHEDHVGGISGALEYAYAETVFCPVTEYDSKAFTNFAKAVKKQGNTITVPQAGEIYMLGGAAMEILHCDPEAEDPNNTSIVLRIVHGDTAFLFTGDAELPVEEKILEEGRVIDCTVLKAGHHGSSTSNSYRWVYEAWPAYAVISVGKDNTYGHPHKEVLSRFKDAGIEVLRTDKMGDIVCYGNGKELEFQTAR
ncbi:MAG: MBL fold metallo-hydrolase [Oscillospiraceae bacterium]|nr:MBL fold metallo-hydrolase [Oscillospiraceae bacterium]